MFLVASLGAAGDSIPRSAPADRVKTTDVTFQDDEGYKLVLTFDESGKVTETKGSKNGNPLEARTFELKDSYLCFGEPSKGNCAPIQFLSEGTLIKTGTSTCVCGYYGNVYRCIGYPTCP
jgi:hypothetical protein